MEETNENFTVQVSNHVWTDHPGDHPLLAPQAALAGAEPTGLAQLLILGNWIASPAYLVLFRPIYVARVSARGTNNARPFRR